jgi:hypothetical protein
VKLTGQIRVADGGTRMTGAEAASYDAAKAALEAQVHEGEQLLYIRRIED